MKRKYLNFNIIIILSVLTLLFGTGTHIGAQTQFQQFINHVYSLSNTAEKTAAVDSFMNFAAQYGFPFIEENSAHFIYRGTASTVHVAGDMNGWNGSSNSLNNLPGTDFFYFSKVFESNARIDYKYILNGSNWILDPRNPNTAPGGFGANSELAMPDYVQPWEINYQSNIQHGTLEFHQFTGTLLGRTYQVRVYLPPGYNPLGNKLYPTAYFQDGTDYLSYASAQNILDNLIDSSKIEPLIAVFVRPTDRNDEYAFNNRNNYADMFANELVPFIDSIYKTDTQASRRLVLGDSFGGNISALISYKYPEIFGLCGLHSAAFWPNNYEVYDLIVNGEKKEIDYFSVWGTYESLYQNMRNFRDNLIAKGYPFEWAEFPEGHSWGLWRANIDNMLEHFFPQVPTSIAENEEIPLDFVMHQNYPNPFNPETKISFVIPNGVQGFSTLKVYDILGREVATLLNKYLDAGAYSVEFDGSNLTSGVYFYRLTSGNNIITKKMILQK